jgi:hypothetical protein
MRVTSTALPLPPPDDASLSDVVPLGEFLWSLRARGMAVGLRDYRSIERLLLRWPATDVHQLRDAVASLIARNEQEVSGVRAAFDEWFDEQPALPPLPPPKTRCVPRSHAVIAVLAVVLTALSTAAGVKAWRWTHQPPPPAVVQPAPPHPDTATLPPPPSLPPGLRGDSLRISALFASVAALLVLSVAAVRRTRRRRAEWKRTYLNDSLADAIGPTRYEPDVKRAEPLIDRSWVEDVATIVGRGVDTDETGDQLDVDQSLRLTLRAGLRPQLAFEPPPRNAAILILHDVSAEMRPWREKIDAFVAELVRQRVAVDRWFFDSDPSIVWSESFGERVTLERLSAQRGHLSLLVISSDAAGRLAEEHSSVAVLRRWNYRSWLNPVANPAYWPAALWRLPIRVWPLTRNGLRGMAWDLAHTSLAAPNELADAPRAVSADDIERMKRLIALVPSPTLALADELRRRYASDIPEEVVLFLAAEGAFRGERYSLPKEEIVRLLSAERIDSPSRETRVRQYLLEVLRDSEPTAGSVAHLRWQLDVAMQQVHVNAIAGGPHEKAVTVLGTLAEGPLREEVEAAAGILASGCTVGGAVRRALRDAASRLPSVVPESVRTLPPWFAWPGLAALPIAAVIAACTFAGLRPFGRGTGDIVPHKVAYHLTDAGNGVYSLSGLLTAPPTVDLYAGERMLTKMTVPATIRPDVDGVYLQARALLPTGQLALSNLVWIPKAQPAATLRKAVATPAPAPPLTPAPKEPVILDADVPGKPGKPQDIQMAKAVPQRGTLNVGGPSGKAIAVEGQGTSLAMTPDRGVVSLSMTGKSAATMRLTSPRPGVQLVQTEIGHYDLLAPSGTYEVEVSIGGIHSTTQWIGVTNGTRRREVLAPDILFESGSAELDRQTLTSTTRKTYKVEERTEFEIVRTDGSVVAFRKVAGRDIWRRSADNSTANQSVISNDLDYGGAARVNGTEGMILKGAPDLFIPNRVTPAGSGIDDRSAFLSSAGQWKPYGSVRDYK